MTRSRLHTMLIAMFAMALVIAFAGTDSASAQQNPNCCTYTVDIAGLTPNCVNIRLSTRWNCAGTPVTIIKSYGANGITIEPIGPPLLAPCPPACKLLSISLNNVNFFGPNIPGTFNIGGCCYKAIFTYDAAGCIYIKIRPC